MKCRVNVTAFTDIPILIERQIFRRYVSRDDLACRESAIIHDWYHPNWFREGDGYLYFTPPAFCFRDNHFFCINGRHRAVLLCRHMEVFPLLLVRPRGSSSCISEGIAHSYLKDEQEIYLPDLPIRQEKDI